MKKKIVTIGGGKGQSTILEGLQEYASKVHLSAIVSMVDDGGSTGRISSQLGIPPFGGDFRDVMTSLSKNSLMTDLFHHRYEFEADIRGHSVGNLILLGILEKSGWDIPKSIEIAKELLQIDADIFPSTIDKVTLVAEYSDNTIVKGQDEIDNNLEKKFLTIKKCYTEPEAKAYEPAAQAIREADLIVLSPGDLYGSLLCNIVVPGISDALKESFAPIIYITNLMTKVNQTNEWQASDFITEIQRYIPRKIDYAVVNNGVFPESMTGSEQYKEEQWEIVKNDIEADEYEGIKVIKDALWHEGQEYRRVSSDVIPRSFIRHDPKKLASIIMEKIEEIT